MQMWRKDRQNTGTLERVKCHIWTYSETENTRKLRGDYGRNLVLANIAERQTEESRMDDVIT